MSKSVIGNTTIRVQVIVEVSGIGPYGPEWTLEACATQALKEGEEAVRNTLQRDPYKNGSIRVVRVLGAAIVSTQATPD